MNMEPESLQHDFDSVFAGIRQVREAFAPRLTPREVGIVTNVSTGIATLQAFPAWGMRSW
jgi:F-type H+-transporting ATPase subunit alpha